MRKIIMGHTGREDIYHINQKKHIMEIFDIEICGITYPDKRYEIMRHHSKVLCIEYVEQGIGTVKINDKIFYPQAGDSYILPLEHYHHYYSDKKKPWKKIFINIRGALVENLLYGYSLENHFHFKGLDLSNELYSIIDLAKNETEDCTEQIIIIINSIFYKMRKFIKEQESSNSVAEKMKEYLRINAASKFKMENLCEYISRSESQTIKIFKDSYGITPYAYFLNRKISLAKGMLLNTNLTIKQIAYSLNFTDEYYFSNVFKQKTGMSPTKYRKKG